MAKLPEMSADFARWYFEAFMDEGKTRAARWKGVVETAADADYMAVEVLVRYAFSTKAPASGWKNEGLSEEHQTVLATILGGASPMEPAHNLRELQILSAAVLVQLFSRMPDAAIAVLNASFGGVRQVDLPMDLPSLASHSLLELSKNKHARLAEKEFQIAAPRLTFEVSTEAMEDMSADQWKLELHRLRDVTRTAVNAVVNEQNRVTELLTRRIALGDEELQMLWWLIGGYSEVAGTHFSEVGVALRPLAFGKELGKLTEVSPGPASVMSLLSRSGISADVVKISDAVNATDVDWNRDITQSTRISPVTTPLHFALEKRCEVDSNEAWLTTWAAMTGLPAEVSMPAIKLAELFYREHLFLHVDG